MFWLLVLLPEILAGVVLLIPLFLIYQARFFHSWKRTLLYFIFASYLVTVLCLVGFPSIRYHGFDANVNLIPIVSMVENITDTVLNIFMFVPLGFFLPLLWPRYRKPASTLLFAFCATLTIELSQLFTFRATDVNDLITNVLGALCGFFAAKVVTRDFRRHPKDANSKIDLPLIYGTSVFVMFFLQPFLYPILWELMN